MAEPVAGKAGPRNPVSGRKSANQLGKSPANNGQRAPGTNPTGRTAAGGPQPTPYQGSRQPVVAKKLEPLRGPPAPAWLSGLVKGVDVTTQFQVRPHLLYDWDTVAAATQFLTAEPWLVNDRITFVKIKATIGAGQGAFTSGFDENWFKLGTMYRRFIRGAYHFLLFGPDQDATRQADTYLAAVGSLDGSLPAVLDVEDERPSVVAWMDADRRNHRAKCINDIQIWLDRVEAATKRKPIIYTFTKYWPFIGSPTQFKDYPLWIAYYSLSPRGPSPKLPEGGGWTKWLFWQFAGFPQTKTQFVPGMDHGVDLDLFNGDLLQLLRLVYPKLVPPMLPPFL